MNGHIESIVEKSAQEKYHVALESNIWKVKLTNFLLGFLIYAPLLFISFQEKGISFAAIGVLMVFGSVIPMLFTVPTGILADRWGRKRVLIIAGLCGIASMLLWTSHLYLVLMLGVIFRGLLDACVSGTDTALLYDSLKELGRETEYGKHNGQRYGAGMIGFSIAALVASLLPTTSNYQYHFLLTAAVFLLGIAVILTIREPRVHQPAKGTTYWTHLVTAFHTTRTHRELRKIITYQFALFGTLFVVLTYFQFFMRGAGIPTSSFGYLYACLALVAVIFSQSADTIERHLGRKTILWIMPLILVAGMLCMILAQGPVLVIIGLVLVEIMLGLQGALLNKYLQHHVESTYRSTIDSLAGLYGGVYRGIMYLIMGFIAQYLSIQWAFGFLLGLMSFLIVPPLVLLIRERDEKRA